VQSLTVSTERLATRILRVGDGDGTPVVLLHGNQSTSRFWDQTLAALPGSFHAVAPDLRGFGHTESLPVDATGGMRDFADDLHSLLQAPELGMAGRRVHLVGWSVGGAVAMRYAIDHPEAVTSMVLVAPMSPYGFGGTRDERGTPCWPDFAGSGAGTANPDYVRMLGEGDRGDGPLSPRQVMNDFYFRPPFRADPEREEAYLDAVLETAVGEDNYPGDGTTSGNWPGVAPGTRGVNNALSPKYCELSGLAGIDPKPPVLWIRGADDQVISDISMFDFGYLGKLGAVPGWPGDGVYPPQPMIGQTRAVLDAYRAGGGTYREAVVEACGHSPQVERPEAFMELLRAHLEAF
jgi:pimeloyl-ACP methyl ester carboxylesterase